eukprot:3167914-Amphidinium_carterae.1
MNTAIGIAQCRSGRWMQGGPRRLKAYTSGGTCTCSACGKVMFYAREGGTQCTASRTTELERTRFTQPMPLTLVWESTDAKVSRSVPSCL